MEKKNFKELQISNEGIVYDAFLNAQKGTIDIYNSIKDKIANIVGLSQKTLNDEKESISKVNKIVLDEKQTKLLKVFKEDYLNSKENLDINSKKRFDYINIKDIKAYVPDGLSSNYIDVLNLIENGLDYCVNIYKTNLNDYSILLARITSEKNYEKLLEANELKYLENEKNRELANLYKEKCYKNNNISVVKIKDVVDNLKQWEMVIEKLYLLNEKAKQIDLNEIISCINRCSETLDIIIQNKYNKLDNLSPEMLRQITNSTLSMAKDLEFIAVVKFDLLSLSGSINNTITNLVDNYIK